MSIYYIHEAQSSLIEDWAIFMAKEGKEMFQNKGQRYVTKGVMDSLPVELQTLCWNLIDQNVQKQFPLDYLQIFEFSTEKGNAVCIIKRDK